MYPSLISGAIRFLAVNFGNDFSWSWIITGSESENIDYINMILYRVGQN